MAGNPDNRCPLPAKDFCNKWGEGNPILGKGALGNPDKQKMYYSGGDRERYIKTVQMMLSDLRYDIGSSGADGRYGVQTETAVKKFQDEHTDWDGQRLPADGLVGPHTADALNRAMVGVDGWFDSYRTETVLTKEFVLLTVTTTALQSMQSLEVKGMKRARVVLVGSLPKTLLSHLSLLLRSNSGSYPIKNHPYRIQTGEGELRGTTDEDGFLCHKNVPPGDYALTIDGIEGVTLVPTLPLDIERREIRIDGYYLYDAGDTDVPVIDEEGEISLNQIDEEEGWEAVPDE